MLANQTATLPSAKPVDQYGNSLTVNDASSGGDYRVDVLFNPALNSRDNPSGSK